MGPNGKHIIASDVQGLHSERHWECLTPTLFRWPQQVRLHCEVLSGPGDDDVLFATE